MKLHRVDTHTGLAIAARDFGGVGPDLVMVHATGFCGAVFEPVARALADRFRCVAIDLRGHGDSATPPDGDFAWPHFALDVLDVLDALGIEQPYAFGHSCGATTLFLAEQARPRSFRAFYCYEPALGFAGTQRSAQPNALSQSARRRRAEFAGEAALREYLAGKALFRSWHPDALDAYVQHGFRRLTDGRLALKCAPASEAATFENGTTHDCLARLAEIDAPVTLVYGDQPDSFAEPMRRAVAERLRHVELRVLDGHGHLGPMEDPARVAREIGAAFRP